jgi:hypothetical protein
LLQNYLPLVPKWLSKRPLLPQRLQQEAYLHHYHHNKAEDYKVFYLV